MVSPIIPRLLPALVFPLAALLYGAGMQWNLPSEERAGLILPLERRTPEKLAAMKAARERIYGIFQGAEAADVYAELHGLKPSRGALPSPEELAKHLSNGMVQSGQGDEHRTLIALSKMHPGRLEFNPHMFFYGGPFVYAMGAAGFLASKGLGLFELKPDIAFYYSNPGQMRRLWLTLRWANFAFALALAVAAWVFSRATFGAAEAGVAAAFFALAPVMTYNAHIVKPHQLGALFWLAAVWACFRLVRSGGEARWYAASGALAGLATGTAHEGVSACLVILLAHLTALAQRPGGLKTNWARAADWKQLAAAAGLSLFVYLLVNPFVLPSWEEFRYEIFTSAVPQFPFRLHPVPLALGWAVTWPKAMGTLLWALAHGALWMLWRRGGEERFLALACAASLFFTVTLISPNALNAENLGRDLLGPIALACLAVARALVLSRAWQPAFRRTAAFLAAAAVGSNLSASACYDLNLIRDNPLQANAMQAGRFLNTLPAGSRLAFLSEDLRPGGQPPFEYERFRVVFLLRTTPEALAQDPPEYVVIAETLEPAPGWRGLPAPWKAFLGRHYEPIRSFHDPLPLCGRTLDGVYHANFPVHVFRRKP